MNDVSTQDVYQAAHGLGLLQAAGPLPIGVARTSLMAWSRIPGVTIGEMFHNYRLGMRDYFDAADNRDGSMV